MKKHHLYTKFLRTAIFSFILMAALLSNITAQEVSSESTVDWINNNFSSTLSLDMNKAGLVFPTGKTTAINRINSQLPILIKDKILALNVDSFYQLEDLVLNGTYSFAEIMTAVGVVVGFIAGYLFKRDVTQVQVAGDNSTQIQIGK